MGPIASKINPYIESPYGQTQPQEPHIWPNPETVSGARIPGQGQIRHPGVRIPPGCQNPEIRVSGPPRIRAPPIIITPENSVGKKNPLFFGPAAISAPGFAIRGPPNTVQVLLIWGQGPKATRLAACTHPALYRNPRKRQKVAPRCEIP